ncbi:SMC family ATPase [Chryseobacterium sp. POL2]|uniref:AAA family ATPase n=1 Tax=Chryseobacterium sp. POL2 TaxID=2713414 RepID=UPI0013E1A9C7|nr:SMC family ATPase [Chryseobacterium sp. POL2]QIG89628.1 SMC family ATPase [Chryseobacterium sp. POL2]
MIPQKLTIEGLYSYQDRQTIDFSKLTQVGLFGIFGAVGSGKSSILEAISFALYGETERLNARDKRAYNMMNLKSNRSYIEFDFLNHENKLFRATREYKRNSKNFEDVKPASAIFYEFKNGNWQPLEHTNAEEIIGLTYTNFKRTIIIPQGQFKEFLELGEMERTKMMKEIFNLHRFDLQDEVSKLTKQNQSLLDQMQGHLQGFESVSEEGISVLKNQLFEQKETTAKIQKEFNLINDNFQRLKALKTDFESLIQKKNDFQKLNEKKIEMETQKQELDIFEKVYNAFFQLLKDQKRFQTELKTHLSDKDIQQGNLKQLQAKVDEVLQKIEVLKPEFEQLSHKKVEENDLGFLIQIKTFETEIEEIKKRTKKGFYKVEEVKELEKTISEFIQKTEKEIQELSKNRIDSQILMNVGNWFTNNENLQRNFKNQQQKIQNLEIQNSEVSEELSVLKVNEQTFTEDFKIQLETLETKKKNLESQKNHFKVQEQLSQYAHQLHDGEACPLCGALEHPNIVEIEDISAHLNSVVQKILDAENEQKSIRNLQTQVEKIIFKKQNFAEQLKTEKQSLEALNTQILEHQKTFIWEEFEANNPEFFIKKKADAADLETQINSKNEVLKQKRVDLENERKSLEKFAKALQQFELEEARKSTQIQQNKMHLKVLKYDDFKTENSENLILQLNDLKAKNLATEQSFNQFNKELGELNPKLASQKTALELLDKRILELQKELESLNNQISAKLVEEKIDSMEKVDEILALPIDIPNQRKEIQNFSIAFETLKNGIAELEIKLKDFSFDDNQFSETENQFKTKEKELLEANTLQTKTSAEIERLEKEFKKKEELLQEYSTLEKRAENLKTMFNLFKGAGFVNFVSSIYLRQLCDQANVRFHRMTRNQLSLHLDDKGNFEIIDYLNEGRSRSVKTLSGGQAFQASLSLALALAESVQTNAKAEKNFFFIDEGFGTQDTESVNIVFETLTSLQKENRIVGIISHVEELKERIPMSLSIEKDEEKGSKVLVS